MASLRHLALSFVLLVSSALPAAAGPVEISYTDLCVSMGASVVGSDSRVVGFPACMGGIPAGIASAAVALPVAAVAGGVASLWGSGGSVFGSVWGVGTFAGFGVGAWASGYPVYLAKAAVWDPPNNIACSLFERCGGVKPDPGVDYQAKKRDVLRNLPYEVYRPNLPVGFEMTEPTLRAGFSGTHDAIVDSTVWRATAETTGRPPDDSRRRVTIYQMDDLGLVPEHCPRYDVTVEHDLREFTGACSESGRLVDGSALYRTRLENGEFESYYTVRLGGPMRRTLLVVDFGPEFDEAEIAELLPMLENMRIVPLMDMISALEQR